VEVAADLCLLGLLFELVGSVVLARYVLVTDGVFFLHVGTVFAHPVAPQLCLSFCFDEVSGVFIGILTFALLICFFFLTEYFEYDSRAGGILLLSALFSQAATLYFCAFDLVTLVFFWELLGLISFLLVQHWAFRLTTYKAGLKVLLFSLIGDLFLFFFLFWVLDHFGTTDMAELLALLHVSRFDFVSVGALLFRVQSLLAFCLYAAFSLKAAQ
jgi:NADH:ubiquinone oxidoreductase subunit 5 (subunit L)/multisubunit Na+/H+ antiporter MnhA subunit